MYDALVSTPVLAPVRQGRSALDWAARSWFLVAATGQWIFVAYILAMYGRVAWRGPQILDESPLPNGFVPGDTAGTAAVIAHTLLAVIIIGAGPLQLMPQIRRAVPALHRWLGRSYLSAAVVSSLTGLYMVWIRGNSVGDWLMHLSITIDGVLIIVCALMAVRHAMARNMVAHRRWALRLFMVASAVWFFRIGLMGWAMTTGGVGIDFETFTGPFITFWGFGQYLLPLAVLELYFLAQQSSSHGLRSTAAAVVGLATVLTAVGVTAATLGMWLPRL